MDSRIVKPTIQACKIIHIWGHYLLGIPERWTQSKGEGAGALGFDDEDRLTVVCERDGMIRKGGNRDVGQD